MPTTSERSADEQKPFVLRSADKKPVFKLADECLSSCNNKVSALTLIYCFLIKIVY